MASAAIPLLLTLMVIFPKGHSELIRTRRSVTATVGEDAHFNCQLTQFKDVLQVTWQKMLPERVENLASYNKLIGTRINPPFLGKVELEDAGLQNNSLVVRSVTKQDECCYRCMFNTFPEGAFTGKTCLKVHEQLESKSHTESSENVKEVSTTIPDVTQPSVVGTVMTVSVGVGVGVAVGVVCCVLLGAMIFALLKRRSVGRDVKTRCCNDPEMEKAPQTPIKETGQPLLTEEVQIRLRTPKRSLKDMDGTPIKETGQPLVTEEFQMRLRTPLKRTNTDNMDGNRRSRSLLCFDGHV